MALFEKKFCDICGEKIGLLGNNKAADGNICSKCYGKLSPFFRGLKNTTVQNINNQLVYREQNRQKLNYFSPSKVLGSKTKVYIDETNRCFVVSKKSDYKTENADIIELSQILNVAAKEKEHKKELYAKDSEGHTTSYNPPRYEFTYEITLNITVNAQYFNEINFEVTDSGNRPKDKSSQEYLQYAQTANQIIVALKGGNAAQGLNLGGIGNILNTAVGGLGALSSQQNNGYNVTPNIGCNQPNTGYSQQPGIGYNQTSSYNGQNVGYNQPNTGYSQQPGIGYNQTSSYNGQNVGYNQPNTGYAQQPGIGYNQTSSYNGQNVGYNQPNTGYAQQPGIGYNQTSGYNGQNSGYNSYDSNGFNAQGHRNQYGQNQNFGVNGLGQENVAQQNFGQQNMNGLSWICPVCGTNNVANFCQNCGRQKS